MRSSHAFLLSNPAVVRTQCTGQRSRSAFEKYHRLAAHVLIRVVVEAQGRGVYSPTHEDQIGIEPLDGLMGARVDGDIGAID